MRHYLNKILTQGYFEKVCACGDKIPGPVLDSFFVPIPSLPGSVSLGVDETFEAVVVVAAAFGVVALI